MIRAVIFDIGGVLASDVWEHLFFDKDSGIAYAYNLNANRVREVGKELWEEFAYRNTGRENDWEALEKQYWHLFIERFQLSTPVDDFLRATDKSIQPIEGMNQLLEWLQSKGVDLAICSDNTEFWFARQRDRLGLHKFFNSSKVILSSRIGAPKSSPCFEMFQATISALGMEKDLCIFVDDREDNIGRALQFGLAGILFPSHPKHGAQYLKLLLEKMML